MQDTKVASVHFEHAPGDKQANLDKLLKNLPSLRKPTINQLAQNGWVAVDTVIDEHVVREIIPELKAAGAEGIVEYPLNKVVY